MAKQNKKEMLTRFNSKFKGMRFTSSRFRIPYVANVPIEQEQRLNEQANQEVTWTAQKNKERLNKFNNLNSHFRMVADYLSEYFSVHFMDTLSYEKVADKTGLSEAEVRGIVSELASWTYYHLTIVKTPKKKGEFQLSSRNQEDTDRWITYQSRCIATKQERLDKTVNTTLLKRTKKKSKKVIKNAANQMP